MSEYPLPKGFLDALSPLLGDEKDAFIASYADTPHRGVRFRDARRPLDACELLNAVPWAENAYYLAERSRAGASVFHEAGAYYLQEPSAMTSAAALCPADGDTVLDLCAAPGGKATQLARYIPHGTLIANEPLPQRARVLSRNIERMGLQNAVVTSAYPEALAERWPLFFDKIMVDAPCSGEGMFRRHPETRLEWDVLSPMRCAERQLSILRCAARMLRPGGRMAYSTCTLNNIENEGVMAAFLREQTHFRLVPFALPALPEAPGGMLRVWPHRVRGEGHFVALLEKNDIAPGESKKAAPTPLSAPERAEIAFFEDALGDAAGDIRPDARFAGRLILSPPRVPDLTGIKTLRVGLHIGEARGRVFLPDHALALAAALKRTYPLSPEAAARYLHGEALLCPEALRGFYALTLDGWQLGFGKASGGMMKNHYPKGLRK